MYQYDASTGDAAIKAAVFRDTTLQREDYLRRRAAPARQGRIGRERVERIERCDHIGVGRSRRQHSDAMFRHDPPHISDTVRDDRKTTAQYLSHAGGRATELAQA